MSIPQGRTAEAMGFDRVMDTEAVVGRFSWK